MNLGDRNLNRPKSIAPVPPAAANHHPPRRRPQPIIIYTRPPRVYHTTPSSFKELVQRLTGKPKSSPKLYSAAAIDGSSNRTPAQLPPPTEGPEAHGRVGVETPANSTSVSQPPAEAPPDFADETNLYSPPMKKVKLEKDTLSSSSRPPPPSENSEFADRENFEAAYSSLMPFAAFPLCCDSPSSPSSSPEEIPPSILADIDLDSPQTLR